MTLYVLKIDTEEFSMNVSGCLVSSKVIKESGITFGTSGARGLVEQFTSNVCAAFSIAFISAIKHKFVINQIAIGIDNRPSSYAIAQACALTLSELNIDVIYCGVIPTPALAYTANQKSIPAIMVTGSHIPFDRNGLKFYRPDGEITKEDEQNILNEAVSFYGLKELPHLVVNEKAAVEYISRYTSLFEEPWLVGKRIGIYEHSSAGRDIYHKIFEAFGATVISLGRSDLFVPIDTEAVSEDDVLKAINWSKDYNLDLVFSTDGDGDRPLVTDERGNWIRGDILGLIASQALGIEALSVPVSCNTAIELCGRFSVVKRTKIGSPYVIEEFSALCDKYKAVAGFEANGGYLLGSDVEVNNHILKALPTRDAVLPVLMLLMASIEQPISKLLKELPQRYTYSDRIKNFTAEDSRQLMSCGNSMPQKLIESLGFEKSKVLITDNTDGLRLSLSDDRVLHLRPSGNAPEMRCYAEANCPKIAKDMVVCCLKKLVEKH